MRHDDERIRRYLNQGDPAGEAMSPEETARMRRTILEASRSTRSGAAGSAPKLLWTAVALSIVVAGVLFWQERPGSGPRSRPERAASRASEHLLEVRPARVIHFITPSGTRVIWTLRDDSRALRPVIPDERS